MILNEGHKHSDILLLSCYPVHKKIMSSVQKCRPWRPAAAHWRRGGVVVCHQPFGTLLTTPPLPSHSLDEANRCCHASAQLSPSVNLHRNISCQTLPSLACPSQSHSITLCAVGAMIAAQAPGQIPILLVQRCHHSHWLQCSMPERGKGRQGCDNAIQTILEGRG